MRPELEGCAYGNVSGTILYLQASKHGRHVHARPPSGNRDRWQDTGGDQLFSATHMAPKGARVPRGSNSGIDTHLFSEPLPPFAQQRHALLFAPRMSLKSRNNNNNNNNNNKNNKNNNNKNNKNKKNTNNLNMMMQHFFNPAVRFKECGGSSALCATSLRHGNRQKGFATPAVILIKTLAVCFDKTENHAHVARFRQTLHLSTTKDV